jgi:nickel-dependent lactate racemase
VVDERGRALRIYAGEWRAAHQVGCSEYLTSHSLAIPRKRELVIASCGGSPYDLNLIQAHKALEMAAHACCEGGTIILLAECRDGLGHPTFLKWFDEPSSNALERRLRDAYEVNGQTAWSLLTKSERYRVVLVSDLPDDQVRLMQMIPAHSLTSALNELAVESQGYIMPHGARFLPRVVS